VTNSRNREDFKSLRRRHSAGDRNRGEVKENPTPQWKGVLKEHGLLEATQTPEEKRGTGRGVQKGGLPRSKTCPSCQIQKKKGEEAKGKIHAKVIVT